MTETTSIETVPDLKSRLRADAEAHPESTGAAALRRALAEIGALEAAGEAELDDAQVATLLTKAAGDLRDEATVCLHTGEEGRAAHLVAEAEALEACLPRTIGRSEAEAVVDTVIDMLTDDGRDAADLQPESVVGTASWILADRFDHEGLTEIVRSKLGLDVESVRRNRSAVC